MLVLIWRLGTLNVSDIAKRIGLNYSATDKHLRLLEAEGIFVQRTYGRIRMYKYSETSPKAKAIQNLIQEWEQPNNR